MVGSTFHYNAAGRQEKGHKRSTLPRREMQITPTVDHQSNVIRAVTVISFGRDKGLILRNTP